MTLWVTMALSGLATFLTRALPLVTTAALPATGPIRRYLDALPTAVVAALAGAAVLAPADQPTRGVEPLAAAIVCAVALWKRNLLLAVLAGTAIVAMLRAGAIG